MGLRPFAALGRPSAAAIAFDVLSATRASTDEIAALQRQRLTALLATAQGTRLYRRVLQGRDLQTLPLAALPVMDKARLMRHFADSVTDPGHHARRLARVLCRSATHRPALPRPLLGLGELRQQRAAGTVRAGRCGDGRLRRIGGHASPFATSVGALPRPAGPGRALRLRRRHRRPFRQHRLGAATDGGPAAGWRRTGAASRSCSPLPRWWRSSTSTSRRSSPPTRPPPCCWPAKRRGGACTCGPRRSGPAARRCRQSCARISNRPSAPRFATATVRRSSCPSPGSAATVGCTSMPTG